MEKESECNLQDEIPILSGQEKSRSGLSLRSYECDTDTMPVAKYFIFFNLK
jgi:hypothetical protein